MISLAETIPHDINLPGPAEAEEGYCNHGRRWVRNLEMGLDEEKLDDLEQAYAVQEIRLLEAGRGRLIPGIQDFIAQCRSMNLATALGADADRNYLVGVADRYELDRLFQFMLCTEEFGQGGADEMLEEIMRQAEVNPSETLVLATRPDYFQAARSLDVLTIGCGWGIHQHDALTQADMQSLILSQLFPVIEKADALAMHNLE